MVLEQFIEKAEGKRRERLVEVDDFVVRRRKINVEAFLHIARRLTPVYGEVLKATPDFSNIAGKNAKAEEAYAELKAVIKKACLHLAFEKPPSEHYEAALLAKKNYETRDGITEEDWRQFVDKSGGEKQARQKIVGYEKFIDALKKKFNKEAKRQARKGFMEDKLVADVAFDHFKNALSMPLGHASAIKTYYGTE